MIDHNNKPTQGHLPTMDMGEVPGAIHTEHAALLESFIIKLRWRENLGDDELAEDLLARLRDEPLPGLAVPVNLEMLTEILEGDPGLMSSGYLDLHTGEVFPTELTDPAVAGEDLAIDIEPNPERYLSVEHTHGRVGWKDMAELVNWWRIFPPIDKSDGLGIFS